MISRETWQTLVARIEELEGIFSSDDFETKQGPDGKQVRLKARKFTGGTSSSSCIFGEIITIPPVESGSAKKAIRGGVVTAGKKTWNVPPNELNLAASGEWLVWLEVSVTANNDSGVNIPGLDTSTAPSWEKRSVSSGYPDTTQPNSTGTGGKAIIPIGKLTIADSSAKLDPARCGNVSVGFCPPNLSIS